jgi:cyclophilin family peptidyl-prolyl cis-trans isomerase
MGNSGKNANTSQFFFTLAPCPQLDGNIIFQAQEKLRGNEQRNDYLEDFFHLRFDRRRF